MGGPDAKFNEVAARFVCVRITDMRDVDIGALRFDFDLTLAVILMHPDGTIYHRFGGRDHTGPLSWATMPGLVRAMETTLRDHAAYMKNPRPPKPAPRRTISDLGPFARKDAQKRIECVHCHMVNEAERDLAIERGRWKREDIWVWPEPERTGLTIDPDDQALVRAVAEGSAAAKAGLKAGDRLLRSGDRALATINDLQGVFDRAPSGATTMDIAFERAGKEASAHLSLPAGWKAGTPLTFSWRPSKWKLRPNPGFGGPPMSGEEREKLGLPAGGCAFRVNYLITWGEDADTGRNAEKAGLRKGDVVLGVDGGPRFESPDHFQAWFRLEARPGRDVTLLLWRKGRVEKLRLPVLP